ncbi:hypothetical protein G0D87_06400 [Burkholderia multivorans]|uniref:hypothetical protein n=1 Tax=Burkholderia multivorans TaxID=87883 RepID=UPI0019D04A0E|nr:hypothetical protein [Burkholderia multivorans]MBN7130310.1 hypothetical protein [Burkholderia multivorans]QSL24843.1 hypothetical protein G0D92_06445 [Burkholderia multivorans]QSL53652.1 hypothetical protein G0D87_06400 [Burkholderia multivorans]
MATIAPRLPIVTNMMLPARSGDARRVDMPAAVRCGPSSGARCRVGGAYATSSPRRCARFECEKSDLDQIGDTA